MNAVVVAYRWTPVKERALNRLTKGLIDPKSIWVVENHAQTNWTGSQFQVVHGSNRFAEFSGYLEGMELVNPGPTLILNDTALIHHSVSFWKLQILRWQQQAISGIYGDPRREDFQIEHGGLSYYASWIFWVSSANAFDQLRASLQYAVERWDQVFSTDPNYRAFINRYLRGSLLHGWKNAGLRDQKAQDLKIRCIWAEHRLSRVLQDQGYQLHDLSGGHIIPMRGLDRLYSFRRRAQSFLR